MGHYDDVRDERDKREDKESIRRTGLSLSEWRILDYLQEKVDAYDEFMNVEVKRVALKELRDKAEKFQSEKTWSSYELNKENKEND